MNIWQKAASPSFHHSRRRMYLSAHSPAMVGEQCAMHLCVGTLRCAGICPPQKCLFPEGYLDPQLKRGSLDQRQSTSERHLHRFSRLCTAYVCSQHTQAHKETDTTQTTIPATSAAVGCIFALCARDTA